jgi:hypothetical protein
MITDKTFKFYWCHIHLIQELTQEELNRYSNSISMSNFPSSVIKLLYKAIERRRKEALKAINIENAMVVQEELSEVS